MTRGQRRTLAIGLMLIALSVAFLALVPRPPRQITVHVDGQDHHLTSSHATTVGQVLNESGIPVGPLDRVSPPVTSALSSSPLISIIRVQTVDVTRSIPIPFTSITSDDPRRARGYRQITQAGAAGSSEITETVTTEDGVEVKRQQIGERVAREPVTERMVVGTRDDPALDAFRESILGYLGRGGVTRLTPSVVEQTVVELAHLRGDHYGSVRVLTQNGRPWLVLDTFSRTPDDMALFVFWWTDELHAFGQVLSEGLYMLDARARKGTDAIELGLVLSAGQGSQTLAPQFLLYQLPLTQQQANTWQPVWSSQGLAAWRSSQGTVTFSGEGLERIEVRGASSTPDDTGTAIVECLGCPRRRFESVWQRQDKMYVPVAQGIVPSPYAALWAFVDGLHSSNITATLSLVTDTNVISVALKSGLGRPDVRWSTTGRETDTSFDLRSKDTSVRVSLAQRGKDWIIAAVGPVPGQGRILFTGTRPVVRGLFVMDTSASSPPLALGEGQRYTWSPDYAHLAYDWQGLVYVADSDGGNARILGTGVAPAWSADGKQLAFERPGGKGPVIILYNLDEGREAVLIGGSRPAWAPGQGASSQRLVFSYSSSANTPSSVYLLDVAIGTPILLASDGSEPLWSPDGGAVAFLTSRQEVAVVTLMPASVSTVGKGWGYFWSVDGQKLAFLSSKPAGKPMVWLRENGEIKALLERDDIDGISWSPDGKEIIVSLANGGGLWLAGSDGSNLRKLGDGREPIWAWPPRAGR